MDADQSKNVIGHGGEASTVLCVGGVKKDQEQRMQVAKMSMLPYRGREGGAFGGSRI